MIMPMMMITIINMIILTHGNDKKNNTIIMMIIIIIIINIMIIIIIIIMIIILIIIVMIVIVMLMIMLTLLVIHIVIINRAGAMRDNELFGFKRIKIQQRGVHWKQGVVIHMMLYTSLLYNTTPIHCTPPPTATPCNEYPQEAGRGQGGGRRVHLRGAYYHYYYDC